jgi:hypothetical protein
MFGWVTNHVWVIWLPNGSYRLAHDGDRFSDLECFECGVWFLDAGSAREIHASCPGPDLDHMILEVVSGSQ